VVIAHAGMNARTVMLWTAEEQKFFSEYAPTSIAAKGAASPPYASAAAKRWRWWWSESIEGSLCPPFLGLPVIR